MDIYSEKILEHFRNSPYKHLLKNPSRRVVEFNPLCGDVVQLDICIKNSRITHAGFLGIGCAISQAATSLLIEHLQGKTVAQAKKITPKKVFGYLGVPISPARQKCAILGLTALLKAVTINKLKGGKKRNGKNTRKK